LQHKEQHKKELLCSNEYPLKMKLLADENIMLRLVGFLNKAGFDTKFAPKGWRNSELFLLANKEERILLTHDKHFLNSELFPPKLSSGIIVLRIHPPDLAKLKSALLKLFKELSEEDIKGKLLVLREDSVEISA